MKTKVFTLVLDWNGKRTSSDYKTLKALGAGAKKLEGLFDSLPAELKAGKELKVNLAILADGK